MHAHCKISFRNTLEMGSPFFCPHPEHVWTGHPQPALHTHANIGLHSRDRPPQNSSTKLGHFEKWKGARLIITRVKQKHKPRLCWQTWREGHSACVHVCFCWWSCFLHQWDPILHVILALIFSSALPLESLFTRTCRSPYHALSNGCNLLHGVDVPQSPYTLNDRRGLLKAC